MPDARAAEILRKKVDAARAGADLQKAIAKYLSTHGWIVLVAGELQVRRPSSSVQFSYEFVMRFTGKQN